MRATASSKATCCSPSKNGAQHTFCELFRLDRPAGKKSNLGRTTTHHSPNCRIEPSRRVKTRSKWSPLDTRSSKWAALFHALVSDVVVVKNCSPMTKNNSILRMMINQFFCLFYWKLKQVAEDLQKVAQAFFDGFCIFFEPCEIDEKLRQKFAKSASQTLSMVSHRPPQVILNSRSQGTMWGMPRSLTENVRRPPS